MKKLWLKPTAAAGFLLLATAAQAQQKNEFSIQQCVDYAVKNSVTVKNALLDIKKQEQVNKEVTALAYPQVNASVGLTDYLEIPTSLIPAQFFGGAPGTFAAVKFGTKYNANGGIDASQILFDGQVFVGLQARNTLIKFAEKNAEITSEGIKLNIYKIYYQLVVGKKQLQTVEENIVTMQKLLHDQGEMYKNGFVEKLDLDKTSVQVTNLVTEKQKIENLLEAGNASLKFLIGMPQKDQLLLTDSLNEDELKQGILETGFKYSDRKEMQLLDYAKKLNEYNIRRYKLSYIPTVAAFASYSKNAQRSQFDFFGKGDWFTTSLVGIKIQASLFDGFAKKSKISQAKIDLQKTNNNIEQYKQLIDHDMEQAKLKMKSALLTLDAQKRNMEQAEKVYSTTKKKYEQGLGSSMELIFAQSELKLAQANYYSASYDAINAKTDWLKATGKL
ncbi:MAG: TolC family protein [Ferruginibacter sp.]